MKTIVFSLALLGATLLPTTEAWFNYVNVGRRSDIAQQCPFNCQRYCPDDSCYVVCANTCVLKQTAVNDKHLRPFPHNFKTYDKNGDGFISVGEMSKTLKAGKESSSAALILADDNGDGKLSKKEFDAAPYHKLEPGEKPKAERYFEESDTEPEYEEQTEKRTKKKDR